MAQLLVPAAALAALLGVFEVGLHPLWSGHPSGPAQLDPTISPTTSIGWSGVALMLFFVAAACLPFQPYAMALRAAAGAAAGAISHRLVVGLTAALALIACLIYPTNGSDVFDYVGFERMWVVYGDNPLLALPATRPQDWATPFVWFPDRTPAYGPLWALLTWPIARLAGDSPDAVVVGYKILSITAYAACCWLVWSNAAPDRRQTALIAFAWSPLVLVEVLGKVHNDILPALAMLVAVWLLTRRAGSGVLSLPALMAGGLVKVSALPAAPALLLHLWRQGRWRAVVASSGIAALLAVACYAAFWQGPASLASIWNQTSRVIWSPISLLSILSAWLPGGPYLTAVRLLAGLGWAAACAALILRKEATQPSKLASTCGWVLALSVLLLTSTVYAHYLVPVVALAAVSDDARLQRVALWLSVGGVAAYNIDWLSTTLGRVWLTSDSYRVLGTLVELGPATLAAWLAERHTPSPRACVQPASIEAPAWR